MAILGVGVDIVDLERFEGLIGRWGKRFLDRLFTSRELEDAGGRKRSGESLAGIFAAKEALIKALGGRWGLSWKDMEVARSRRGRPVVRLDPSKAPFRVGRIHLSISHDGRYALACCIVEDEG